MNRIICLVLLLLPFSCILAQKGLDIGLVSQVNLLNTYRPNHQEHYIGGYSGGISSTYFLNKSFAIVADLMYTRMDYKGRIYMECIVFPGGLPSDIHHHAELVLSLRYFILKNKLINPYLSAGFAQSSRSKKYLYMDVDGNKSPSLNSGFTLYNYGVIAAIGSRIQLNKNFSADIECSVRNYVREPSYAVQFLSLSPAIRIQYQLF